MNTEFIPGPWKIETEEWNTPKKPKDAICSIKSDDYFVANILNAPREDANARLIESAPEGFKAIEEAYITILQIPGCNWRRNNQNTYIILRDYLARVLDKDMREVQEHYEEVAYLRNKDK